MALRIGLLILASCNLFNADVITVNRGAVIAPRPVVSFPLEAKHGDGDHDDNDHENTGPKLGAELRPLGYNSEQRQRKDNGKEVEHRWVVSSRSEGNWVRRQGSEKREWVRRDGGKSGQRRTRGSKDSHHSQDKRPVVVSIKPAVVAVKPSVVQVQKPVPVAVVVEQPRPSVVVSNYVIGQNAVRQSHEKFDDDHIDVNRTPVNFGSLRYVDNDNHEQTAKAPITIVTVPSISTARPTQHTVAPNQVINQSNTPSVENHRNRLADQLLFSYNNLLKTKIHEVTDVQVPAKTPVPAPVRSELVRPGKLEHIVKGQLRVGQRNENAPIIIQKFLANINERAQDCDEDHDHSVHESVIVVRKP